jgi:methylamine dehydrogenase accessory protein MauD
MVELALLAARLLLAAVFVLAGVTKFVDRRGSTKALNGFGLPPGLAQPLSLLLPAAEIVVAVALVPVAFAWYGACGALALLSIFAIGISVTLARGRRPDCRCFGQLHSAPVGWATLVRNGILAAPAAWLVSRGRLQAGPSLWAHFAMAGGVERRVFIVAACVACFLLFRALRGGEQAEAESMTIESQHAPARDSEQPLPQRPAPGRTPAARISVNTAPVRKLQQRGPAPQRMLPTEIGLPIGTRAPEFALPGITGQKRSLGSLLEEGKTIFLVFSSPYCESCQALSPSISRWMREYKELLNIVVVTRGTARENLAKLKDFEISQVLLQQDFEVAEAYDCVSTPAAVLIGADGLIRSGLAVGRPAIEQLIASSLPGMAPIKKQPGTSNSAL